MVTLTARRFFSADRADVGPEAECAFFSSLKMRNGTFKLTRPSRFAAVEARIAPIIREKGARIRQVLDVGVSSGLTTVELARFLHAEGTEPRVIGTDLFIDGHLVQVAPGLYVLADDEGWPLQYDIAGRAVRAWVRRLDYVTLAFAPRVIGRVLLVRRLRRAISEGRSRPVRMECRALSNHNIELVENDILSATPQFVGQFDMIRAANVLNLSYFSTDLIRRAAANIISYCRGPGSLLLTVRSQGPDHHGTLFEYLADGTLTVRTRIGRGSEVESLFLGGVRSNGRPNV